MSEERNNDMEVRDVLQTNDTAYRGRGPRQGLRRGENVVHALRDERTFRSAAQVHRDHGPSAPANPR